MFGGLHSPRPLPEDGALVAVAREFTPRVEAPAPTPVLLDLSGLGRLWPTPQALGRALLDAAAARAIEAQAALAFSRAAALVLARARPGLTVVPAGGERAALAPLPLDLLGIGAERLLLFRRWGLRTIGDLARLPPVSLAARFGPEGPRLARLARGEDEGAPRPHAAPRAVRDDARAGLAGGRPRAAGLPALAACSSRSAPPSPRGGRRRPRSRSSSASSTARRTRAR